MSGSEFLMSVIISIIALILSVISILLNNYHNKKNNQSAKKQINILENQLKFLEEKYQEREKNKPIKKIDNAINSTKEFKNGIEVFLRSQDRKTIKPLIVDKQIKFEKDFMGDKSFYPIHSKVLNYHNLVWQLQALLDKEDLQYHTQIGQILDDIIKKLQEKKEGNK